MDLSRREALHRLTLLVGGAISAPTLAALTSGCRAEPAPADWVPKALTADQVELLGTLVDVILPATDTPGASAVGVPMFIDTMLDGWAEPEDRQRFLTGLTGVDAAAQTAHGVGFRNATAAQQQTLLEALDRDAIAARHAGTDPLPFFAHLKEWTLVGYYTSQVGATEELHWLPIPGRYDGNLPLTEVGRTWA